MSYHANNPAGGVRSPSAPALERRFIKMGHTCLGVSDGGSLTLTGADQHDSLLWSRKANKHTGTAHSWSPYGSSKPADASLPGFNGERIDPVSGTYHLGNGYRTYNPVLMRFNCPDSLSPFGAGGINPYAYCAGDPVNHTDPSGHLSWQAILGITLGAIGLAAAVFTGGMSIAAAGGVAAALGSASATALVVGSLGVVADVTAIASGAVEDSAPAASSILDWVSLAFGLPGMITGLARLGKTIKGAIKGRGSYSLTKAAKLSSSNAGSKLTTMGGSMRNSDHLEYGIYAFTDTYKGKDRLNIAAHGTLIGENSRMKIGKIPNRVRYLDADELAGWLKSRYDLSAYDNLRTISCYSGYGGQSSFAAQLSRATRKPVKGYVSGLIGNFEAYRLTANFRSHEILGTYKAYQDSLAAPDSFFHVCKTNPFKVGSEDYFMWDYQPVKFYPS